MSDRLNAPKRVTFYETTDGKRFERQADALDHERTLAAQGRIDAYLDGVEVDEKPLSDRARARRRSIILAWEMWRLTASEDGVAEGATDEDKAAA